MERKKDYREMINSTAWRRLRRQKLNAQPLCEDCQRSGVLRAATEVHHMKPVESGINPIERHRLMFDWSNLRSLCHECHKAAHIHLGSYDRKAMATRRKKQTHEQIRLLFGSAPEPEGPT